MDLARFVALLEYEALFFPSVIKLDDPFEGVYPRRNLQPGEWSFASFPSEMQDDMKVGFVDLIRRMKAQRSFVCVSCWHEGEHESDAMWKLYSSVGAGVAVQTTFARFCAALKGHEADEVYVGRVRYIDYESDLVQQVGAFPAFLHKRLSFQHEREVRGLVWASDGSGRPPKEERVKAGGIAAKVDLAELVQEVIVSPLAQPWFHDLIDAVVRRYGLHARVKHSQLSDEVPY
jgi:hypothetical protein